jgi:hypothetical protein
MVGYIYIGVLLFQHSSSSSNEVFFFRLLARLYFGLRMLSCQAFETQDDVATRQLDFEDVILFYTILLGIGYCVLGDAQYSVWE